MQFSRCSIFFGDDAAWFLIANFDQEAARVCRASPLLRRSPEI